MNLIRMEFRSVGVILSVTPASLLFVAMANAGLTLATAIILVVLTERKLNNEFDKDGIPICRRNPQRDACQPSVCRHGECGTYPRHRDYSRCLDRKETE